MADREHLYHRVVYLTRVGSQNLLVADKTSAHVVPTVTLPIGQYTYSYECDYPVQLHT